MEENTLENQFSFFKLINAHEGYKSTVYHRHSARIIFIKLVISSNSGFKSLGLRKNVFFKQAREQPATGSVPSVIEGLIADLQLRVLLASFK